MSHVYYPFTVMKESLPHQMLSLRNVASAKYGGDWYSIPHAHSHTELFYIVGGDGQFRIQDSLFPVHAHQLVVVNPNILHTEVSYEAKPLEYIVLGIEGLELTIPGSEETRYGIYSFSENNEVLSCMRNILREMQECRQDYQTVCLAYLDIILVQLMRSGCVCANQTESRFTANQQCAAVRDYIEQHYKEAITLDMLAEKVSINKYSIAHAFKREYGVSPISYVLSCRIREGKRLLAETDLSLSQIATVLGFSSPSYFSQRFRSAEGISPTEYRRANQMK